MAQTAGERNQGGSVFRGAMAAECARYCLSPAIPSAELSCVNPPGPTDGACTLFARLELPANAVHHATPTIWSGFAGRWTTWLQPACLHVARPSIPTKTPQVRWRATLVAQHNLAMAEEKRVERAMIEHETRVHKSAENLLVGEQLGWKIAEVAEMIVNRVIDNAGVAAASLRRRPVMNAAGPH